MDQDCIRPGWATVDQDGLASYSMTIDPGQRVVPGLPLQDRAVLLACSSPTPPGSPLALIQMRQRAAVWLLTRSDNRA